MTPNKSEHSTENENIVFNSTINILLIEDNPGDVRYFEILIRQLKLIKCELKSANTLRSGLEMLKTNSFQVIMLDLSLPDSIGLDTVSETATASNKEIPILVLTGNDDEDFAVKVVAAGAQDYLVKGSIDENTLSRSLRYAIERHQKDLTLLNNKRAIEESQKRLELIVNQNKSGLIVLNTSYKILFVNPAACDMLGETSEELLNTKSSLPEFISNEVVYEITRTKKKVEAQKVDINWSGEDCKLITLHDITDLKKVEQHLNDKNSELMRINKSLDRFAYIISHDLKKPVANINGLLGLIENEIKESVKTENVFKRLYFSTSQLKNMIDNLLETSRNPQGPSAFELINIDELISSILYSMDIYLDESNATVVKDFSRNPIFFYNKQDMESIISNLISNSIKYRKEDIIPSIKLSSDKTGLGSSLTIRDNGRGIDLNVNRDKLFKRGERIQSQGVDGNGLGLWIVKETLDKNNSRIEVESKLGIGTTFTIHF
ncbi:MAG: ATP-binding protein [Bacteroidota bacterium]|nr:ATP-binding protein [Bacteroidota bacterium]